MSFKIEKLFGMVSLALLGLLAISCVPNVKEASTAIPAAQPVAEAPVEISIQNEVDAVRQVEMMNAQARPTFHVGE